MNRRSLRRLEILDPKDHCCQQMVDLIEEERLGLFYTARIRRYTVLCRGQLGLFQLFYCFSCGKKLPDDLAVEFDFILKNDYQIQEPYKAVFNKTVPPEFLTDEWWKKRGA
jgi:hypothetical protein